jgi:2',3'-cyclic-nucleotide 2'-phosphodiesterase (5'-nucleotidase family)
MQVTLRLLLIFLLTGAMTSCNKVFHPAQINTASLQVKGDVIDSGLNRMLLPYREKMNNALGEVIGYAQTDLTKSQPECNLGNFMADALMEAATREYGIQPDVAFMNYGGIRLPVIKQGGITTGKIYELFPFDNLLVLVTLKGQVLQSFLDHISARGGWPVSGIKMQIRDKKAVNVFIGGKALHNDSTYVIALGDYTANGGDDAVMLKGMPQLNKGYLMRDAFLSYLHRLKMEGKNLSVVTEKRVTYAE